MEATTQSDAAATTQLDPAFVEELTQRFFAAWNALDGDALVALCTEDVVWNEPMLPQPARGADDVRAFVADSAVTFPDFHVERCGAAFISSVEPMVLTRYRMTATMKGAWRHSGRLPTGRAIDVLAVDEWTLRGELISHYRTYYDTLDMGRQLGIVPPAGSRGERALTRVHNLRMRLTRAPLAAERRLAERA